MGLAADAAPDPDFIGPPVLPLVRWAGLPGGEAAHAELRICPLPMVDDDMVALFKMWPFWQRGQFPNPGTFMDQPNGFVEAMERIRRHMEIADAEDREKQ